MQWIRGYHIPLTHTPRQDYSPSNNNFNSTEKLILSKEINKLLELGAISSCSPVCGQFLSSIFTVPKNDGTHRFILNLKAFNKFVETSHFKLEDVRTVCKLLLKGDYMTTIDMKNAYFLVPVQVNHRHFLRFMFFGKLYQFNCLPFGLASAPFVFTKLLKPVVEHLRNKGVRIVLYLDDAICLGSSYEECLKNTNYVTSLLEKLGFVLNSTKSCLKPSRVRDYLGFNLNSQDLTISPTDKKKERLTVLIQQFLKRDSCTIREFAKLLGNLVSVCMAVAYGFVYTKILEREKFLSLEACGGNYENNIIISKEVKQDLLWWKRNIVTGYSRIKQYNFELEIFSDASGTGWGAFCNGQSARGQWSDEELSFHINYRELLAAFFALKCFAQDLTNCEILLRIDNTTAISYVNRLGGVQYPLLNGLTRQIWQWCEARKLWIFASYIKSKENINADFESRVVNIDTEWQLSTDAFNIIMTKLGMPEIDIFASRVNAKCDKYISWHRDPSAWNVDAFTVNWSKFFFYAFPPFCLLLKAVQKIRTDRATGIVVFPMWPSQPWYPLLMSMVVSEIVSMNPSENLLTAFRKAHPLNKQLFLGACVLSGKHLNEEAYQKTQ